jgi:hypothetical protein
MTLEPNPVVGGRPVVLDGRRSTGQRVDSWTWEHVTSDGVAEQLGVGAVLSFSSPPVEEPTDFDIRLTIYGLGGSPPQTTAYAYGTLHILPGPTVTPGGPTVTPRPTRTVTPTPRPTDTPLPTSTPVYTLCVCVAEAPGEPCSERFVSVSIRDTELSGAPDLTTGELCFEWIGPGTYALSVSPRCNPFGCRPEQVAVEVVNQNVYVSIPSLEPASTQTPSASPVDTPSPTAILVPKSTGDCDGNSVVDVSELIRVVRIALGEAALTTCEAADRNQDRLVGIAEIVDAVSGSMQSVAKLPARNHGRLQEALR